MKIFLNPKIAKRRTCSSIGWMHLDRYKILGIWKLRDFFSLLLRGNLAGPEIWTSNLVDGLAGNVNRSFWSGSSLSDSCEFWQSIRSLVIISVLTFHETEDMLLKRRQDKGYSDAVRKQGGFEGQFSTMSNSVL